MFGQRLVGAVQPLQHTLLFGREVGDNAVQEQRGFVEQAFRGLDVLDHNAPRHRVQQSILFRRQFAACEDDHRHFRDVAILRELLEHLEPREVWQAQVQYDAVERFGTDGIKALLAGGSRADFNVVVAQKFADTHQLGCIVFDDKQPPLPAVGKISDASQLVFEVLGVGRLGEERKCPTRKAVLAVLIGGNHLNRDMAGLWILLELAQDVPAQRIRQEDIQRNGTGAILTRQIDGIGTARGNQDLESLVAGKPGKDARIMRIVLDNQKRKVVRLDVETIIGNVLGLPFRNPRDLTEGRGQLLTAARRALGADGAGVANRQVQDEGAAGTGRTAQREFAAEQIGELAADGKTKARAAILAASARVRPAGRLRK